MPTGSLFLLAFLALSVLSVSSAKGAKWKLLNIGAILAGFGIGLLMGWAAGTWGRNAAIGADIAIPLAEGLGAVAALGTWRRNKVRDKAAKPNIITTEEAAPPLETSQS